MRVFLVDDDRLTLKTWRRVLTQMKIEVVTASTYSEAETLIKQLPSGSISLAIVDLVLDDCRSGIDLIKLLRESWPATKIILVSAFLNASVGLSLHRNGVLALNKPLDPLTIVDLVRQSGSPQPSRFWIRQVFPTLSNREAEVLELGGAGLEDNAIASKLGIQQSTVATYWKRIYEKTGKRTARAVLGVVIAWLTKNVGIV